MKVLNHSFGCLEILRAMAGQQPSAIITDQDLAMTIAIKKFMMEACIGFAYEHSQETPREVGVNLFSNPNLHNRFVLYVWESKTADEFENK